MSKPLTKEVTEDFELMCSFKNVLAYRDKLIFDGMSKEKADDFIAMTLVKFLRGRNE